jgi:potassium channel subfamily K
LAVPTLTILISNMGDTVIKAFRDLTIWVGSLTVLPGENGPSSTLKLGLHRLKHGKLYRAEDNDESPEGAAEQRLLDRLAEHVEEKELDLAEEVRHSTVRSIYLELCRYFQTWHHPLETMSANSAM